MDNKKIIIFGTGDLAELLTYYIKHDTDWEVACFSINEEYMTGTTFLGLLVIPFEKLEKDFSPNKYEILLGIGYTKMNAIREKIFNECKEKGYVVSKYIHSSAIIGTEDIGEGTIILERSIVQPFASIGKANIIWCNTVIAHNAIIGDFNTLSAAVSVSGFVGVKNNCFLGNQSMVLDHVVLEDFTLVGAGAIVKKNTHKFATIVPARSIVLEHKKSTEFI